jgi:hypothetical protein
VLPRLIDDHRREQLGRIEFAHRKTIEPSFVPARHALELSAAYIPELDINSVGATLTEEQDDHGIGV